MIYIIGGTPRAGKSTLAKKLVERQAVPFLSTDFILHMVNDTLPETKLTKPYAEIPLKFFPYIKNLIKHIKNSIKDYTIEGDAFLPAQIFELQKDYDLKVCFLGFSKITLPEIKDYVGENNWLNDLSDFDINNLPQWIIEKSQTLKQDCEKYNIKYFDMADGLYEQNLEKAYTYLVEGK
ncbi:MAG: hypothetical protein V1664_01685 [Candidatus Uhrbacteria bacterium]